jgi:chromosomal replication initiation ATPase DnaA
VITNERIIGLIESECGVLWEEIISTSRIAEIKDARHIYCYLCNKHLRYGCAVLGRRLEKDHSSIIHAIRRVRKEIEENNPSIKNPITIIEDALLSGTI